MTSLAFIFGVAPLVVATGAGSEMRQSLGTTVFAGMLGVPDFEGTTAFGAKRTFVDGANASQATQLAQS